MNPEQLTKHAMSQAKDISALWESTKSAHKRIDENDRIIEGIHKLAANVEGLTLQVKMLTDQMDATIERIEEGQKLQGERIGKLEQEPAHKWQDFVKQVLSLAVAAVFGVVASVLI
jgi:hypothetical protein